MSVKFFIGSLGMVISLLILSTNSFAHGGATGIVKERMDAMTSMSKAMKRLTPMLRGKAEYDSGLISDLALKIASQSGQHLVAKFPAGSDGGVSQAKSSIWTQWDRFETYANDMEITAKALSIAALKTTELSVDNNSAGGLGMMTDDAMGVMQTTRSAPTVEMLSEMPVTDVFRKLNQSCTACHTRFRSERK